MDDDRMMRFSWRRFFLLRGCARHPSTSIVILFAVTASLAILINALYLQSGPHPAPIFRAMQRPVAAREAPRSVSTLTPARANEGAGRAETSTSPRPEVVANIQRELARRGFYDGPADGIYGGKTDVAIRDFAQAAGLKSPAEPSEELLRVIVRWAGKPSARGATAPVRNDPIADLIAPSSKRVIAVQHALAEYGYGQLKATGMVDAETKATIEKFERDRRLPITGQISQRLMRELGALTGRSHLE
jgi:peptidoglycan hydrolase-like protein with peptidoglycan-binding domain